MKNASQKEQGAATKVRIEQVRDGEARLGFLGHRESRLRKVFRGCDALQDPLELDRAPDRHDEVAH